MLQIMVTPMRSRLLTNTTGVARYIAIWEVMPAPGPGAGNPVVLMKQPPSRFVLASWELIRLTISAAFLVGCLVADEHILWLARATRTKFNESREE
jgi:hypothetical protein